MINKFIDHKLLLYFVAAVIPLLSISIFLADLIISILSIFFLIFLIKNNSSIFFKNSFFLLFLIFYFLSIVSSLLSENILYSLKSSLPLIRIIIFIFLISYLFDKKKEFIDVVYNFVKYTFLILVIYGFVTYFYEYYHLSSKNELELRNIRLELPFSDEAKLGSYLVRIYGIFLALYLFKKRKNNFENYLFFFLSLMTSIIILLSGERTSLFFMILFASLCVFFLSIGLKTKIIYFVSIILISFLFLSYNTNLSNRIIFDKNNEINLSSDNVIIFTAQHTAHYKSGLKMFSHKPLIGQGPKMFRKLCNRYDYFEIIIKENGDAYTGCSSHPHNSYVQLLSETGIIGAIIFSLGFFHILINFAKHLTFLFFKKGKKLTDYQIVINLTALIVFWPFSPSGNLFNNWMLIIYSLSISLYVNEYFKYKKFKVY